MKLKFNRRQYNIIIAALEYFENDIRDGEPLTAGGRRVQLSEFCDIEKAIIRAFEKKEV